MQENSPLYTMASSLEDALDNILQIMAEWLGEKEGGNVDVRTELDVSAQTFDSAAATAVQALRGVVIYVRSMLFACCRPSNLLIRMRSPKR